MNQEVETEGTENSNQIDKIYTNTIFIRGIFYILFVASIITLFELVFFTVIIVPQQTQEINVFIKELSKNYKNIIFREIYKSDENYDPIIEYYKKESEIYVLVAMERENNLILKINNDSIGFITLEIIALFVIMTYIYMHLLYITKINYFSKKYKSTEIIVSEQTDPENPSPPVSPAPETIETVETNESIIPTVISAILTIMVLAFFQIFMYNFAKKFKYTGAYGLEEILYIVQNKLRTEIPIN